MTIWRYLASFAAMAVLLAPVPGQAHPHVWVTVETKVVFNDAGAITGFRHKWVFDEYYTAFALQGMDANGDGEYSAAELEPLARTNIESLGDFDYFTFAELGEQKLLRNDPVDYDLVYDGTLLTLHFTLPLAEPVPPEKAGQFSFSVYDPTFFVSFSLADEQPVTLAGNVPAGCTTEIGEAPAASTTTQTLGEAFFDSLDPAQDWGAQFAQDVALRCKPAS
ncbi:DUF1007 family protein [Dichotomicrobium thermohalophilum]|uniref:ABC-type uncharacterized transport system substrate-binding protein n=1 Tax=Dichotomicrobium thermohalophilum TaxID=933063 RepID=A0A397QBS8_9HYPH|nr:DUF1007 family protein [Dichotomicrobium thermohalophilum]RIA55544.1 ABC-type uncharacterized transport system substrate-binding protein [Dichotomicrobium thermohalophilum]